MVRKVILAEDDPDDRDLFKAFLSERVDVKLLPAVGNGMELLAALEDLSDENLPDLIVLDQNMPMMNGRQTLEALRVHPRFSAIPAVIYSTYTDSALITECKRLGARMVAMKPIDGEGYHNMMNDFLLILMAKV